jgi:tetratricopeptide (TPR) repeat protein
MRQNEKKTAKTLHWSARISLLALLAAKLCLAQPTSEELFNDYWARGVIRSEPRVAHFFVDRNIDGEITQKDALIKAYSYRALGWDIRAKDSYSRAIAPPYNDPASDWAAFWIGEMLHQSGKDEYLREVFSIRSPPWGRFWLGVWYFLISEYDTAAGIFNPLSIGVRGQAIMRLMAGYFEGLSLMRMGATDRAEQVFEGLLRRFPRNIAEGEINYRMGSIEFSKGEWDSCREKLEAAMEFYEISTRKSAHWWADEALFLLAAVDFMENRHLVAMRKFERLRFRFPDSPYVDRLPYLELLGEIETKATRADQDKVLSENLDPDLNADVLMRIAYLFLQDGEFATAQNSFAKAGDVAESKALKGECYLFAGECAYKRRRYREALSYYQLAYDYSPDRKRESGWGLAWCHIRNRHYDDARIYLSGVFSGFDDDLSERARLIYAETFLKEGRPGRAAQELTDFLKTCRGEVCDEALYDLIQCYVALGDTARIVESSNEFLVKYRRNRKADDVVNRLNDILFAKKNYSELITLSDNIESYSVSRETADRVRVSAELGRMYLGIHQDALQVLESFLERYPDSPIIGDIFLDIGTYLCESKEWEKGTIVFDRLRKRAIPDSILVEANYRMGRCYLEMNDTSAASDIFTHLINEYHEFALAARGMINYGDYLLENGDLDGAMIAYNKVIEKAQNPVELNYTELRLALTYERMGRYPEARILYNNLRDNTEALDIIRADALLGLVRVYFSMAEYERGYRVASEVFDTLRTGEFKCVLGEQIGKLAVRLGDVDAALKILVPVQGDTLLCAGSEDQTLLYDLSLALEFRNRIDDANRVWLWMIETSEDDSIVALARKKIEKHRGKSY